MKKTLIEKTSDKLVQAFLNNKLISPIPKKFSKKLYNAQKFRKLCESKIKLPVIGFKAAGTGIPVMKKLREKEPFYASIYKMNVIKSGRKVKINNYETSILNLLFNNSEIKINSLLNLLGNEKLNYNHQLRIASQTINDLNNKITVFMDLESSFIILSKSDLDKRIKIYKLNDNVRIMIS